TADEIDRMLAIRANWQKQGWQVEADLIDAYPHLTREKSLEWCKETIGYVPTLYQRGHSHKNCGGFCVKAGHGSMARLLYYNRALFLEHERMELLHQQTFNHTSTIMRDTKTRGGITTRTPLTLRDFR